MDQIVATSRSPKNLLQLNPELLGSEAASSPLSTTPYAHWQICGAEVCEDLRSTNRLQIAQGLTRIFFNVAGHYDHDSIAKLQGVYGVALDEYARAEPGEPSTAALDQRAFSKAKRRQGLQDRVDDILEETPDADAQARLLLWHAKTAQLIDIIANVTYVENVISRGRPIINEMYEAYAKHLADGNPAEDFKWDFSKAQYAGERLFVPHDKELGKALNGNHHIFKDPAEFIGALRECLYTIVGTPHPTNYLSYQAAVVLHDLADDIRNLGLASDDQRRDRFLQVIQGLDDLARVVPTPLADDQKQPRKFTVREEVEFGALMFSFAFDNTEQAAGTLLRTMRRMNEVRRWYTEEQFDELALTYHLPLHLGSWFGADKDGHGGKKAEHMLLEEVLFRRSVAQKYLSNIRHLEKAGVTFGGAAEDVKKRLHSIVQTLSEIDGAMKAAETADGDIVLSQSEYDGLVRSMYEAPLLPSERSEAGRTEESFLKLGTQLDQMIEGAYGNPNHTNQKRENKDATLWLLNNVRRFGMIAAQQELRETSELHEEAVFHLLGKPASIGQESAFGAWDRKTFAQIVNDKVVDDLPGWSATIQAYLDAIDGTENHRSLATIQGKIYHTLKRFQRAQNSQGAASGMVMAETQDAASLLTAVALARATARPGQKAGIRIIPLFEDFESLNGIPGILKDAFAHKAFRDYILELADGDISRLSFEVMIAHSDNTKRAGNWASRASVHTAHREVTAFFSDPENLEWLKEQYRKDGAANVDNLDLQMLFHEGKSASHVSRFGVVPQTAWVSGFGVYKYAKQTMQGADLLPHLGMTTVMKLETSAHARQVADLVAKEADNGNCSTNNLILDNAVAKAFKDSFDDFCRDYYNNEPNLRGYLAVHPIINLPADSLTSAGSRPGKRGDSAKEPCYAYNDNGEIVTRPVPMTSLRAIGDANNQYDMEAHSGWFASRNIERYLVAQFGGDEEQRAQLQRLTGEGVKLFDGDSLTGEAAQVLYKHSVIYRECVDIASYALMQADLENLQARLDKAEQEHNIPIVDEIKQLMSNYVTDNIAAAKIVLKSHGVDPAIVGVRPSAENTVEACSTYRNAIEDLAISRLAPENDLKTNLTKLSQSMRDEVLAKAWKRAADAGKSFIVSEPGALTPTERLILRACTIGTQIKGHGFAPDAMYPPVSKTAMCMNAVNDHKPGSPHQPSRLAGLAA